jgi:hypothetical protein
MHQREVVRIALYYQAGPVSNHGGIYWWYNNINVLVGCETGVDSEVFTLD